MSNNTWNKLKQNKNTVSILVNYIIFLINYPFNVYKINKINK